ncbi:MAG: hypothetical protein ABS95_01100 [Verrucomicrobia bacterium SCN 57-15]|nr:MAG: hypothetical protein ABS95_01100 [Verrucomicrobia bacterium SCN 57-15]
MRLALQYSSVTFPDTIRVFGFTLQPVTLGHALLLQSQRSPFVVGGDKSDGHLIVALYILSRPWRKGERGLRSGWVRWRMKSLWGNQFKLCSELNKLKAIALINKHLDRAWQGPALWENETGGCTLSAPSLLLLKTRLMHCLSCSRDQALDYPLAEAKWDIAGHAEENRCASWVGGEELDFIEGKRHG